MRSWTNQEDRTVIYCSAEEGARMTGRTFSAVQNRKTKLHKQPCPFWVWYRPRKSSLPREMIFCEQGDGGHDGTCCGERTIDEYRRLGGTFSLAEEQEERAR